MTIRFFCPYLLSIKIYSNKQLAKKEGHQL